MNNTNVWLIRFWAETTARASAIVSSLLALGVYEYTLKKYGCLTGHISTPPPKSPAKSQFPKRTAQNQPMFAMGLRPRSAFCPIFPQVLTGLRPGHPIYTPPVSERINRSATMANATCSLLNRPHFPVLEAWDAMGTTQTPFGTARLRAHPSRSLSKIPNPTSPNLTKYNVY